MNNCGLQELLAKQMQYMKQIVDFAKNSLESIDPVDVTADYLDSRVKIFDDYLNCRQGATGSERPARMHFRAVKQLQAAIRVNVHLQNLLMGVWLSVKYICQPF